MMSSGIILEDKIKESQGSSSYKSQGSDLGKKQDLRQGRWRAF